MALTLQIRPEFRVDGTLTDATSAVLSDSTGTYGIKRDDTDAAVVADGTALTSLGTGLYGYDFTPPVEGIAYTWRVEFVYQSESYYDGGTYTASQTTTPDCTEHYTEYADLTAALDDHLGWEGDATRTESIINQAYRRALHPRPMDGRSAHEWTFLRPTHEMSVTAGVQNYDLPTDFARVDGMVYYKENNWAYYPIQEVSIGNLLNLRQYPWSGESSYWPHHYAIIPIKNSPPTKWQQWQIQFWPTPNQSYDYIFRYHSKPCRLDADDHKYPVGGETFAELLRLAVLAEGQRALEDEYGHWNEAYLEQLEAEISYDRKVEPGNLGQIVDTSDGKGGVYYEADFIKLNGVIP
jgi:hypothetical protein